MRHLISLALLVAAAVAYGVGVGPLFFGAPMVGLLLLLIGLGCEIGFWRRFRRRASA